MSDPSDLLISELTGPQNTLVLKGRALPYRGLKFRGKMRNQVTYYPGNPVGTAQMFGPDEGSTPLRGMWKDRFLSEIDENGLALIPPVPQQGIVELNGGVLNGVASIVEAVDGFRRRGLLLQLQWNLQIRRGFLEEFEHDWENSNDVRWEMQFRWISQGEDGTALVFTVDVPPTDIADQILSALQALQAVVLAPFAVINQVKGAVDTAVQGISDAQQIIAETAQQITQTVANATTSITGGILTPLDAAKKTLSALSNVQSNAVAIETAITSVPARALRQSADIKQVTQEQALQAAEYGRVVKQQARAAKNLAARLSQQTAASSVAQPILASFKARAGTDLRQISNQYYGTPEQWRNVATFNGLQNSKLLIGQLLFIPQLGSVT